MEMYQVIIMEEEHQFQAHQQMQEQLHQNQLLLLQAEELLPLEMQVQKLIAEEIILQLIQNQL